MKFHLIVFLLLFPVIYGNECFSYKFEEGFETFDPVLGNVCASVNNKWSLRQYNSTTFSIDPPHPRSNAFITSVAPSSCISSFFFDVENDGEVEVSLYMRYNEFMTIGIYNEAGQQAANWISLTNPITLNEWMTITLTVSTTSTEPIRGYLSLFATVDTDETILVDSFRYIPPNQDADDINCAIYSDDDITVTESSTTENNDITEAPTTGNEPSTTEIDGTTETLTTEYESSTTEFDGTTDIPTTENEASTTEIDSTTEIPTTENGVTNGTSSPDETTDPSEPDTTDNYTDIDFTEAGTEETTEIPDYEWDGDGDESSFWTPLTISLVATGSFLVLLLIIYISYWCGKRKEMKKVPEILYLDIEDLPKPYLVPRVKKVYTDSMNSSNPYAKGYF